MTTNPSVRILHLEDDPDDAELIRLRLRKEGFACELTRVETRAAFQNALEEKRFDLVLADYRLPGFEGTSALKIVREKYPGLPFIFFTGAMGDELAVETLKQGASDYVIKDRPERLAHAIQRALREAQEQLASLMKANQVLQTEVAERQRAERKIRLLYEMTLAIQESDDVTAALSVVLRKVCEATGWVLGQAWLPNANKTLLEQSTAWFSSDPSLENFRSRSSEFKFAPGTGLPGSAWIEKKPVWRTDVTADSNFPRVALARMAGLKAGLAVPVLAGEEVLAVIEFFVSDPQEEDNRLVEFVSTAAAEVGVLIRRKQAEMALRESEERFRSLMHSAKDAIVLADATGVIISWNKAARAMFGYEEKEVLGKPLTILMPERYREMHRKGLARFHATNEAHVIGKTVELHGMHRDGHEFPLELSLATWNVAEKKFFSGIIRDITERKQLEERVRQGEKMQAVGQLAGGIAHDFNNLLTVIEGHAVLLLENEKPDSKKSEALKQIALSANRAGNLTSQLLSFSRQQVMKLQDLDLNAVVSRTTKMLRQILTENVDLRVQFASTPPRVNADLSMVEQIIINLAVNARDAMPKGGRLVITTGSVTMTEELVKQNPEASVGEFACMIFNDTGLGIAPENLPHLFEPFFTTKEIGKGTGLGLATTYGIVKQHGGWIKVESQIGEGTTFQVFLPQSHAAVAETPEEPAVPQKVRSGTETILLVEDEAFLREMVRDVLAHYGYRVLEAGSGVEALKVWRQHRNKVDLLLTDIVMPGGISGRDLAEELLAERSNLKVIYTSGYNLDIVGKDFAIEDGINFLPKPFHPQKLAQMVRDCLDRKA